MVAAEALVYLLTSSAEVAGVVGQRVYPLVVPQDAARPAIGYQRISAQPDHAHTGFSLMTETRWQITIEATSYAQAQQIARAIRRALSGYHGTVGDLQVFSVFAVAETDGYGDIGQVPVVRMDLVMRHDEQ